MKKSETLLPGCDAHESAIYSGLILNGPQTAYRIAKLAAIHRIAADAAIASLAKRGIITKQRRGERTVYIANSPTFLRDALRNQTAKAEAYLTELEHVHGNRKVVEGITVLTGTEEIKSLFIDIVTSLDREGVFYRFIACGPDIDVESFVPPEYRPLRDAKAIQQMAITSATMRGKPYKKGMGCLWKTLPAKEEAFEYGAGQIVYGDKVAFIDYHQKKAFIIESAAIAAMLKAAHRALYSRLEERVT